MRKLTTHIQNLIFELKKEGINFYFDQQISRSKRRLENVIFEKNGIEYKIYEGLFFRDSGQCKYLKGIDFVDLDDKTFYEFQKILIIKHYEKNS